jgi:probable phosphoglycerate mutase
LSSQRIAGILSSDLARAMMTAAPVAAATGLGIRTDPLLQERNFGDLRGCAYDTLGFDPLAMPQAPPGGESEEQFHTRVAAAFAAMLALRAASGGPLAVITHGLVIRAILERHVRREPGAVTPARLENTSVTCFAADAPHAVIALNCIQHLEVADLGAAHAISGI